LSISTTSWTRRREKLLDTGQAAAQATESQSAALKNLLGAIDPTVRAFEIALDDQYAQLIAHFEAE
jgi:hypothetical protein